MRVKTIRVVVLAVLLLALSVTPVAAADPALAVTIEVPTIWCDEANGISCGSFTASGPAVDAGIICPSGDTIDIAAARAAGWQSKTGGFNLFVTKEFTCEDGSGTFLIQLRVRLDARGDHASWVVVGGTGDYGNLHGAGKLVGSPLEGAIVLDTYTGMLN